MGIINVTPDSFFSGSRKVAESEIINTAEQMLSEGATFLDLGGYSSRPGADDISVEEEWKRVEPAIKDILKEFPNAIISVDTFRSQIARRAIDSGAAIINDISAGNLDRNMLSTVANLQVPYIAMHMKGTPQTMKELAEYEDLLKEVLFYFSEVLVRCSELGIKDVILDPGFGFAKDASHSFELLKRLDHFKHTGKPVLAGVSRKSMIYRTLNLTADEALNGTTVLNTVALLKGASILRVHDVKEAMEAIKLVNQLA